MLGGMTPESNAINALTTAIKLEAPSVCPKLLLTDPIGKGETL